MHALSKGNSSCAIKTGPLFTQQVDESIVAKVNSIPSRAKAFATDFMVLDGFDQAQSILTRWEARRDRDVPLWRVDRLIIAPGDLIKKEQVAADLCFFDALHFCARFQVDELNKGKIALSLLSPLWMELPRYSEVARKSGQAIDADGMPHPSLDGYVLTDGFFHADQLALAATTKNVTPEFIGRHHRNTVEIFFGPRVKNGGASNSLSAPLDSGEKAKRIKVFNDAASAGDELCVSVRNAIRNEYTFSKLGSPIRYAFSSRDKMFRESAKTFKDAFSHLPPCDEKKLCESFYKAATMTYWLGRVALNYQKFKDGQLKKMPLKEDSAYITRAIEEAELNDIEAENVRQLYRDCNLILDDMSKKLVEEWCGVEYTDNGCYSDPRYGTYKKRILNRIAMLEGRELN